MNDRMVALVLFAIPIAALAYSPQLYKPTERQLRQRLLSELRPVALKHCRLERYGGAHDGGYLMCGNLLSDVQSGYSYGIGPADDWGCQISRWHRVPVHQYDCFDPGRPRCQGGETIFHDECIGATPSVVDSRVFDTLAGQISKNGDRGKTLVVKIDIEGAEVGSLMAAPERVLDRIDQLAMEIHGVDASFLDLVRKLKRTFHVAHIHFNNHACSTKFRPFPAWAYEVLLVNKRIDARDPSKPPPVLPHPLDAPDTLSWPDCQEVRGAW